MNLQDQTGFSGAFGSAALTLDSGATTYDSVAFAYAIDGIAANKALVSNGASGVPATGALVLLTPASGFSAALVLCTVDIGGTFRFRTKGFVASLSGAPVETFFPDIPLTEIPVAYFTLKGATGIVTSWTFGTSNWNATGMIASTPVNISGLPSFGSVLVS